MSTVKVDHKAEAEKALTAAQNEHGGWEVSLVHSNMAQAHATLYAGEQQRIANLIAWLGEGELSSDSTQRDAEIALATQIREGLALA